MAKKQKNRELSNHEMKNMRGGAEVSRPPSTSKPPVPRFTPPSKSQPSGAPRK